MIILDHMFHLYHLHHSPVGYHLHHLRTKITKMTPRPRKPLALLDTATASATATAAGTAAATAIATHPGKDEDILNALASMTNDVAVRVCSGQNPNVPVPRHYLRAQGQVAKPAASMGFLKNLGYLVNRQSV